AGRFAVGYADSSDGLISGQPANTVELRFTLMGDANLDGIVNGSDALAVGRNFNLTVSAWDRGDFNYNDSVNLTDAQFLTGNWNATVAASGLPAIVTPSLKTAAIINASSTIQVITNDSTNQSTKKTRGKSHPSPG